MVWNALIIAVSGGLITTIIYETFRYLSGITKRQSMSERLETKKGKNEVRRGKLGYYRAVGRLSDGQILRPDKAESPISLAKIAYRDKRRNERLSLGRQYPILFFEVWNWVTPDAGKNFTEPETVLWYAKEKRPIRYGWQRRLIKISGKEAQKIFDATYPQNIKTKLNLYREGDNESRTGKLATGHSSYQEQEQKG